MLRVRAPGWVPVHYTRNYNLFRGEAIIQKNDPDGTSFSSVSLTLQ